VVDFVKVGPWPLFNLADSCITVGGLLLAYLLSRPERGADPQPAAAARGSGGLKSEAPTQEVGNQLEPSGSPPVNRGSGGLKSEAPTPAAGGHPQPSGSPPVNRAGGPPSTPPA
jgi:Signal peptidase (SPase) II